MRASNVVLAESMKSAAQNPVTVTNVLASGIQRMIDAFGPGSDGQILMFERGKAVWRNVPMPVVVRGDGSGGGRKPPEERGDDERRFGGGGGNTATNDGLIETHDHQSDPGGGIIDVNAATRGILAVSRGGTGNASYSTGDLLVGTAVGGLSKLAKGSNSQVLTVSNGTLAWAASAGGGGGSSDTGALMSVFDRRYVNESGDTMTGSLILSGANVGLTASGQIKAGGAIYGSGVLVVAGTGSTKAAFIINSDGSVGDALLVFGSDGTNETLKFLNNEDRFELSDDLNVTGGLYASGALIIGGAGSVKGDFTVNSDQTAADTVLTFGSDSTNETLKFLNNEDRFEFSDDVNVTGGLYATGALIIGGAGSIKGDFTINSDATAADTVLTFGSDSTNETLKFLNNEDRFEFSDDLNVTGGLYATGALIIGGAGSIKGDFTINSDATAADTVLTFGSDSTNETLKFLNNEDRFEFSDDVRITGGTFASGALIVDGAAILKSTLRLNGVTYTFPTSDGSATGKVLKTSAAGVLSWSTDLNTGVAASVTPISSVPS